MDIINKLKGFKAADDSAKEMEETIKEAIKQLQEKDKIINDAIIRIENLRQYFDDGCQADFIEILEILKNKSVIDW